MTLLVAVLFGLLQGLRHAFEPDHVVAISTMLTERQATRARVAYAATWGTGHCSTLLVVGAVLMLARLQVAERVDAAFECTVSVMLIALGVRALGRGLRDVRRAVDRTTAAPAPAPSSAPRRAGALVMGVVHGLAGSGALTALVVARMPSVASGLLEMLVFGAGATLGMSLLAGILGAPLARVLRMRWGAAGLLAATGSASLGLGFVWLLPALARVAVAH